MKLRKRFAAMGAAMVMAVSMMSVGASAETKYWSARHVNNIGAPSSESRVGTAIMVASGDMYTGKVTYMTNITNRQVTIDISDNYHYMTPKVYTNTGNRTWYISGPTQYNVHYRMIAHTDLYTTLNVEGKIIR